MVLLLFMGGVRGKDSTEFFSEVTPTLVRVALIFGIIGGCCSLLCAICAVISLFLRIFVLKKRKTEVGVGVGVAYQGG